MVPYPHRSALICTLVPLRLQGSRASVVDFDPVGSGTFWPVWIPNQNDRFGSGSGSQFEAECDLFGKKNLYIISVNLYFTVDQFAFDQVGNHIFP